MVTLITHGWNSGPDGWVDAMADAIAESAKTNGFESVAEYSLVVDDNAGSIGVSDFRLESGKTDWDFAVVKLDWSDLDGGVGFPGDHTPTGDVAAVVAEYLVNSTSLLQHPLHLIGHSRGASLNSALAEELGKLGIWTDQLTSLDPHPVDGALEPGVTFKFEVPTPLGGIPIFEWTWKPDFQDAPVAEVPETVVFADNYWRRDSTDTIEQGALQALTWVANALIDRVIPLGQLVDISVSKPEMIDFTGEPVGGAMNLRLNEDTLEKGGYDLFRDLSGEHSDVHLWYHGTIDTNDPFSDGKIDGFSPDDLGWYSDAMGPRGSTGYYFSRVVGGSRHAAHATTGLHPILGGTAARRSLRDRTRSEDKWPSLLELQVLNDSATIRAGDHVELLVAWHDYDSEPVVTFFADGDRNPLNGNETLLVYDQLSRAQGAAKTFLSVPTEPLKPSQYYIFAKIDDGENVRYLYAPQRIIVAESVYSVTASTGGNGIISPQGMIEVSASGSQTFVATPDSGYVVDRWFYNTYDNPAQIGGSRFTISDVTDDGWVVVTFKKEPRQGTLAIENPVGGEEFPRGGRVEIRWSAEQLGGDARIELLRNGAVRQVIADRVDATRESVRWRVPDGDALPLGDGYTIRITALDSGIAATSAGFSITREVQEYGTIRINTISELRKIGSGQVIDGIEARPDGYYVLDRDLDLDGVDWQPLPEFRGTFDGQGHTLTNLTIRQLGKQNIGLFSRINDGEVRNLNLGVNAVEGGRNVGAVAGLN
ncbi:MAG: hypothetical protein GXP27_21930, partial [Planctomycetes bacterium]|nr:hypothetical protein [Planctomycetota bacterium]